MPNRLHVICLKIYKDKGTHLSQVFISYTTVMMSGLALLSIICGRVNESQNVPVCVWKKKTCTKQNVKYVPQTKRD